MNREQDRLLAAFLTLDEDTQARLLEVTETWAFRATAAANTESRLARDIFRQMHMAIEQGGTEPGRCEAVIHTGPGHQSRRRCTRTDPHPAAGDHWVTEAVYEWTGPEAYSREI